MHESGYFGALEYHVKKKDPTPYDSFHAGYLLYAAKLNSREGREAPAAFAKAKEDPASRRGRSTTPPCAKARPERGSTTWRGPWNCVTILSRPGPSWRSTC